MMQDIREFLADRIGGKTFRGKSGHKFARVVQLKQEILANNPKQDLIDLGRGEVDEMAHSSLREALKREVDVWENRGYADNGPPEFAEAAARYMRSRFHVDLDPKTQINNCAGTKGALMMIPYSLVNPGDTVIVTMPGYAVFRNHAAFLGANVHTVVLREKDHWLPRLEEIPDEIRQKAKLIVVNYPNNPTGAIAPPSFCEELVSFVKENKMLLINDDAYSDFVYDGEPFSMLATPGAIDVTLETHSMSKLYSMTGWRLGWVAGNATLVSAFRYIKDTIDNGQFAALQKAAITGLDNPGLIATLREKYERRLRGLTEIFRSAGWPITMSAATLYLFCAAPKRIEGGPTFADAESFMEWLLREHQIAMVPFDETGEAYVRISSTFVADTEAKEQALLAELKQRLSAIPFRWD